MMLLFPIGLIAATLISATNACLPIQAVVALNQPAEQSPADWKLGFETDKVGDRHIIKEVQLDSAAAKNGLKAGMSVSAIYLDPNTSGDENLGAFLQKILDDTPSLHGVLLLHVVKEDAADGLEEPVLLLLERERGSLPPARQDERFMAVVPAIMVISFFNRQNQSILGTAHPTAKDRARDVLPLLNRLRSMLQELGTDELSEEATAAVNDLVEQLIAAESEFASFLDDGSGDAIGQRMLSVATANRKATEHLKAMIQ